MTTTTLNAPLCNFLDLTIKLSKLNNLFLQRIGDDLKHNGIRDITAIQALTLKNISESKGSIAMTTREGYYIGQNISYGIIVLLKRDYITKQDDTHDKRCTILSLTEKGKRILDIINISLLQPQEALTKIGIQDTFIEDANRIIEKFSRILEIK